MAPNGSTNAKARPSIRHGSARLDRRRIIVFKGKPKPPEGKDQAARLDRIKTDRTRTVTIR